MTPPKPPPHWVVSLNIAALRLGVKVGSQHLLSIPGRRSGRLRSTPVSIVDVGGLRYVVAAFSEVDWVKNARSRPVLQGTGDWLLSLLPDDPETAILKRLRRPKDGDDSAPPDAPPGPGQRSELGSAPARVAGGDMDAGYKRNDPQGFEQLLESTRGVTR